VTELAATLPAPRTSAPPTAIGLMARLKAETRPAHKAVERQPLAEALIRSTITAPQAALLFRGYLGLHEALEARLDQERDPRVVAVWRGEQRRVPDLRADLATLAAVEVDGGPAFAAAVARARARADVDPASLLGGLYVLEGSRLGGLHLAPRVAAALGGPPPRYFAGLGDATAAAWQGFVARMDAAIADDASQDAALAGAAAMFDAVGDVMAAVWAATT
jgi:heme oxygenase